MKSHEEIQDGIEHSDINEKSCITERRISRKTLSVNLSKHSMIVKQGLSKRTTNGKRLEPTSDRKKLRKKKALVKVHKLDLTELAGNGKRGLSDCIELGLKRQDPKYSEREFHSSLLQRKRNESRQK